MLPSTADIVQVAVPSKTNTIDSTVLYFQRRVSRFCRAYHLPPVNITLCLREALANAIIHGNLEIPSALKDDSWDGFDALVQQRETLPEFASRQVIVRCQMNPTHIKFEVEDEGQGFRVHPEHADPTKRHVINKDSDPLAVSSSGRGLLIITSLMDQVFWNERGNCITMVKRLRK